MATIILKNTTVSAKSWGGVTVAASPGQYTVQEIDRLRLLSDDVFLTDLASGAAVINDGTNNLSATVGLYLLKLDASEGRFNNTTNGYSSTNIQSAIEESKNSSTGAIYTRTFVRQGSAANTWLYQADSGITSNTTPCYIPFDCKLVSCAIANDTGTRSFDIRVNISKAGQGFTVDRTIIYQVRNMRFYSKTTFNNSDSNLTLSAGDKVSLYCQTQGAAPSDLVVTLGFKVLSEADTVNSENITTSAITVTIGPITITLG